MGLSTLDIAIVAAYLAGIFVLAQWVSRGKAGHQNDAKDYFVASKSLPWRAIGASPSDDGRLESIVSRGSGLVMGAEVPDLAEGR